MPEYVGMQDDTIESPIKHALSLRIPYENFQMCNPDLLAPDYGVQVECINNEVDHTVSIRAVAPTAELLDMFIYEIQKQVNLKEYRIAHTPSNNQVIPHSYQYICENCGRREVLAERVMEYWCITCGYHILVDKKARVEMKDEIK